MNMTQRILLSLGILIIDLAVFSTAYGIFLDLYPDCKPTLVQSFSKQSRQPRRYQSKWLNFWISGFISRIDPHYMLFCFIIFL